MGAADAVVHRGHHSHSRGWQEGAAFASPNPLFWKPTPSDGKFVGQRTYGYISFEAFIDAVTEVNSGTKKVADYDGVIPTLGTIVGTTAILESARHSLDLGGQP